MKIWIVAVLALVASVRMSGVVAGEAFRTDINPALQYYQAVLVAPDLSQPDREYLFSKNWQGKELPDRIGPLLNRYDNQFRLVRQAGHATVNCDWGVDFSPGPATLLPQLARVRAITQTARLRAMWFLQKQRESDAVQDLLAALALARNASRDGTLISALVQIAGENAVCATVAENFSQFSASALTQLLGGLDSAPSRGTVAACMAQERVCFRDWFLRRIAELKQQFPGDDAKVMAAIHEVFTGTLDAPGEGQPAQSKPDHWKEVQEASGGTSAGVVKLLQDQEPLYERIGRVLSLPPGEYERQIEAFATEVEHSSNPFVALTFPAIGKCRPKEFAVQAALAMVRAAAGFKSDGEAGLRTVPDPLGAGPFRYQRFDFEGVDRGFKLESAYAGRGFPEVLIFVEKPGTPFQVNGKEAGHPLPK